MSCKSNNDKGKGCQDGDCVYPFIPNYVYCHDPDGKKSKTPVPYSKEYMQQKWGTSVQSYAVQKGLSKNSKDS